MYRTKAETDCFITASQNLRLPTRKHLPKIIKDGLTPLCRLCEQKTESIAHLGSVCPLLASIEYKQWNDHIGHYIHWKIYKYLGILKSEKWCKQQLEQRAETKDVIMYKDFVIETGREKREES